MNVEVQTLHILKNLHRTNTYPYFLFCGNINLRDNALSGGRKLKHFQTFLSWILDLALPSLMII